MTDNQLLSNKLKLFLFLRVFKFSEQSALKTILIITSLTALVIL
jgi:hypothetical protein